MKWHSALRDVSTVAISSLSQMQNGNQNQQGAFQGSGERSSDFWERSMADLKEKCDPHIYNAYIQPLKLGSYNGEKAELHLLAPSRLVCNHVDGNFRTLLENTFRDRLGRSNVALHLSVAPKGMVSEGSKQPRCEAPYVVVKKVRAHQSENSSSASRSPASEVQSTLDSKYTFGSFVVGNNNEFCHAACTHVAEDPGSSYNPLFIYGGVGLGKTHLLHAIGNAIRKARPGAKVLYMSSETFTNELILALRYAKMDEFKNRLRNIEVLLVDDIQFMCGKERTQEEFFHTFNALYSAKRQIVITSDKIPQEIPGIEERLQTRFSWGLTADIQAPDFETRVAILKRKASIDRFSVPEEVAHYIAEKVSSNVRELEGALTKLHAISSLQGAKISLELAESALRPLLRPKKIHVTLEDIQRVVAEYFHIKVSEMVSKRRTKNLSFPRHVAMYLCRKHTTASYPEIGTKFGGRDHSSVIHAANVVSTKLKESQELRTQITEVEAILFQR